MATPYENFIAAGTNVGWVNLTDDGITSLADYAEHLFDHAVRGSDKWATIMVPVRDGAQAAIDAGTTAAGAATEAAVETIQGHLQLATERAERKAIALPVV